MEDYLSEDDDGDRPTTSAVIQSTQEGLAYYDDAITQQDDNLDEDESRGDLTPTTTLRRAKGSFIKNQDRYFRNYEEVREFLVLLYCLGCRE